MSRAAESNVQSLELRVLSTESETQIALAEPAGEAASIADEADIEVSANERADEPEESAAATETPEPLALTCDADLRLSWGELDEWLARS